MSEVKRLQQELAITKSKLQSASEMISKMPSEGIKMVSFIEPVAFSQSKEIQCMLSVTGQPVCTYDTIICTAVLSKCSGLLSISEGYADYYIVILLSLSTTYFECVYTCQRILSD